MAQRLVITAAFDKARNALAIAELAQREGMDIAAIIVVSPYSLKRLQGYVRQRGVGFVLEAFQRLRGSESRGEDAVSTLFEKHAIQASALSDWAKPHNVPYHSVSSLNDEETTSLLSRLEPDWVVYCGGGILKRSFIDAAGGRILNAHAGPLPEVRGMNACEWALLLGHPPQVTVHLINRGIDTGGIIKKYPVEVKRGDDIPTLRSRATAVGIEGLFETLKDPPEAMPAGKGAVSRQCFVLAPALAELLSQRLERAEVPGLSP